MTSLPAMDSILAQPASYRYGDRLPPESAMLEELLRATEIQQLFESYYNLLNIPVAIIDLQANVLLSSRWRRICTQYHRAHPATCARCIESDTKLALQLQEGTGYAIYECQNGLTDCASRIIIEGKHVANVFIGQFLTHVPDENRFRRQAEQCGFEVGEYLGALREVPVVAADRIPFILDLLARMTNVITRLSIDRKRAVESQARQSIILDTIPQSVFWKDTQGRYLGCNAAFAHAAGLAKPEEIIGKTDFDLPWPREETEAYLADDRAVIAANQPRLHFEEPLQQADGSRLVIDTSKAPLVDSGNTVYGVLGIYEDITERRRAEEAKREAGEFARQVIHCGQDGLVVLDCQLRHVVWNKFMEDVTGIRAEEVMGKHPYEVFPELRGRQLVDRLERVLTGQVVTEENAPFNYPRTGRNGWFSITHSPLRNVEGKCIGVIVVMRDVTERKRAEEVLRLNETRLEGLLQLSQMSTSSLDEITHFALEQAVLLTKSKIGYLAFLNKNETVLTMHAWSNDAMAQCEIAEKRLVYPVKDTGLWGEAVRQRRPVVTNDYAAPNPQKKGIPAGHVPVLRHMNVPIFERQRIVGVAGVGNKESDYDPADVRQLTLLMDGMWKLLRRRDAEEALRRSEENYRNLIEQASDAIIISDSELRIIDFNAKACDLLGYSRDEIPGMSVLGLMPKEDEARVWELARKVGSGQTIMAEARCRRKDGAIFPIEISGKMLPNGNFQGIVRDITERRRAEDALREIAGENRRLADMLENSGQPFAVGFPDGRLGTINRAFEQLTGYTREELQKIDWAVALTPPEWREIEQTELKKLQRTSQPVRYEKEYVRKDGTRVPIELLAHLRRDELGIPAFYYAFVTDLTERKGAEEKIKESEARFRALAENSLSGIYIVEAGRLSYVNPALAAMFGYAPEEFIGKSPLDFVHPDDRARVSESINARLRGEVKTVRHECRGLRRDGTIIDLVILSGITQIKGQPSFVGNMLDITDLKRKEENLRTLSRTVEQSPASVMITDLQGNLEYVNPRFTEITGYSFEEVRGKNPRFLNSGETPTGVYGDLWRTISSGGEWRGEFHNRRKDGSLFWEEASISPIRNTTGAITHFLAVKEDITGRKNLEDQLRQAQKMEAIGRLAGGVAHDFNNLLTIINGYAELLTEETPKNDARGAALREILKAGERAAGLTRQLLAFSRKQVIEPRILNLNHTLSNMEKMLRRLIGEDIELCVAPGKQLGQVKADPGQIEQVLLNLTVNARDAMPKGGKLTLETLNVALDETYAQTHPDVAAGNYVLLAVSDTGCGISRETLAHIFEPFFTTKEQGKGTGLGLSTAYGIVKQTGGHIAVYSEVGRGTTFKIYLPRLDQPNEEIEPATTGPARSTGTETILIVEDEPAVRALIRATLAPAGYKILEAGDPSDAVALLERSSEIIQLLVTDVVMPGFSGKELADHLKFQRPNLKVLFISGYTGEAIAHHGVLDEGVAFLSKPFTAAGLLQKIRAVLDEPTSPPGGVSS